MSNLEKFKESFKETRKEAIEFYKAISGKNALSMENAALLAQNGLLGENAKQRKALAKQVSNQKAIQAALAFLQKTTEEKILDSLQKDKNRISKDIRSLENILREKERQNELDQRQASIRNKALSDLSKKEDAINKVYDKRFEALDKVATINERIAQQQQDRIALASALSIGDISGAASVVAQMQATSGSQQIQDTRTALEDQQQRAVEALAISVNGQMMTRQQIESDIDLINERIYQRELTMIPIRDEIFNKQESIRQVDEQIELINERIAQKQEEQIEKGKRLIQRYANAGKKAKNLNDLLGQKIDKEVTIFYKEIGKPAGIPSVGPNMGGMIQTLMYGGKAKKYAMGGMAKKYAMGGMISYKGSTEPPPAISKMAMGSIVPGKGNVDRVPALLTPGEFVVRKSVAQQNLPMLSALNSDIFPSMNSINSGMSELPNVVSSTVVSPNTTLYNYSVNVNVTETDASATDIANTVIRKIRMMGDQEIRGNRI